MNETKVHPLKKLRFFRGITLDRLMLMTGRAVDSTTLSRIERGIYIPTGSQRAAIAKALKVKPEEIFPEERKI